MKKINSQLPIYLNLLVILSIWIMIDSVANSHLDWGGDYAGYLLQAESIQNGDAVFISETLKEMISLTDGEKYTFAQTPGPWGYPLFMSMFEIYHNWDIQRLKNLNLILNLLFLLIFYKILVLKLKKIESLLFTALIAFLPIYLEFHFKLLSEMLFSFLIILGFYFKLQQNMHPKSYLYIFEALIFGIALLVRRQAIIWIFAYLFVSIFVDKSFNKKNIFYVFNFFLPSILIYFILRISPFGNITSSAGEWSGFDALNMERILFIFKEVGYIFTRFPNNLSALIGILIFVFLIYLCFKNFNTENLFLITYAVLHMFYSILDTQRFWMPLIGLIFVNIIFSFKNNLNMTLPKIGIYIFIIATLFYWLNSAIIQKDYYLTSNGPNSESFQELQEFVSSTNDESIYIFHSPRTFYYFTQRKTYRLGQTIHPNSIFVCEKDTASSCTDQRFTKVDNTNASNIFENDKFILYKLSND